jgi:large subunit ribosomal protein L3
MSGHMGVRNRTIENLKIVDIDVPRNLLLISGAVPGSEGGQVIVRPSVKALAQQRRKRLAPNKVQATAAPGAKPAAAKPAAAAKKPDKK